MNEYFLKDIYSILTPTEVITSVEQLKAYNDCTYAQSCTTDCVIKPMPALHTGKDFESIEAMLVSIIEFAKKHQQPLYPISTGKNWGYGSATPTNNGCVILDLSNYNEISSYDPLSGTVTVQPGVTQQQLYEFLLDHEDKYWIDATGGPKNSSILGNICERGFGHSIKGDHFKNIVNLTAVIPLGDNTKPLIEKTGFSGFKNAKAAHVYEYGIGPHSIGLFTQSNFGIVCDVTIKLMPKPEYFQAYFIKISNHHFKKFIDTMAVLKQSGIIESAAHIGNDQKAVQLAAQHYPLDPNIDVSTFIKQSFQKIKEDYGIADWTMSGAFYGPKALVRLKMSIVKRAMADIPHELFTLDQNRLASIKKIKSFMHGTSIGKQIVTQLSRIKLLKTQFNNLNMMDDLEALFYLKKGIPTDHFVNSVYYRKKLPLHSFPKNLEPNRDKVGLIWVAPIAPMEGKCAEEMVNLIKPICEKYNFEATYSITLLTDTAMDCVVSIVFDREEKQEDNDAISCHDEIISICARHGYFIYRNSTRANSVDIDEFKSCQSFDRHLKNKLDPLEILAPNHYITNCTSQADNQNIHHSNVI